MQKQKTVAVAILGYGTVGSGVASILTADRTRICNRYGIDFEIRYILDRFSFEGDPLADKIVHSVDTIADDPEIQVVAEAMGGTHPAYEFVMRCLKAGKSVVTSNKELVAEKGSELLRTAKENGAVFLFEAAVGGATPIIRPMRTTLAAGEIKGVFGILNGTTNFMLTRMKEDGASFDEALSLAQKLGYAETVDPSDDVDAIDPCRKISILASIMTGEHLHPSALSPIGIRNVLASDLKLADALGGGIKLIAYAEKTEDGLSAGVQPMFVPKSHALYAVNDVFNAATFRCFYAGEVTTGGRGAGKLPTGGAVVSDMIEACLIDKDLPLLWTEPETPVRVVSSGSAARFCTARKDAVLTEEEQKTAVVIDDRIGFFTAGCTAEEAEEKQKNLPEGRVYRVFA